MPIFGSTKFVAKKYVKNIDKWGILDLSKAISFGLWLEREQVQDLLEMQLDKQKTTANAGCQLSAVAAGIRRTSRSKVAWDGYCVKVLIKNCYLSLFKSLSFVFWQYGPEDARQADDPLLAHVMFFEEFVECHLAGDNADDTANVSSSSL